MRIHAPRHDQAPEWVRYGAGVILAILVIALLLAGVTGSIRIVRGVFSDAIEKDRVKTQSWASENNCTLAESYFGVVNKWDCEDGSSHWRGP